MLMMEPDGVIIDPTTSAPANTPGVPAQPHAAAVAATVIDRLLDQRVDFDAAIDDVGRTIARQVRDDLYRTVIMPLRLARQAMPVAAG